MIAFDWSDQPYRLATDREKKLLGRPVTLKVKFRFPIITRPEPRSLRHRRMNFSTSGPSSAPLCRRPGVGCLCYSVDLTGFADASEHLPIYAALCDRRPFPLPLSAELPRLRPCPGVRSVAAAIGEPVPVELSR